MTMLKTRKKLYRQLDIEATADERLSFLNKVLIGFILTAIVVTVLSTENTIRELLPRSFDTLHLIFGVVFSAEYIARLWVAKDSPTYSGKWGRLRYAFSPIAIIDMLAVLPFWLSIGMGDSFLLRLVRMTRILALAKLGQYSSALANIVGAIQSRKYELLISLCTALLAMLASATVLYGLEGGNNPESFGSIPRALWWGVATLTTVGYGDVFPITVMGKIFAGVFALAGIGIIALPTGILAGAFADAINKAPTED
jgi:voltage-gated potassium channel